jgi:dTDP-4-dehydrorhamnose 3,5-epimerase
VIEVQRTKLQGVLIIEPRVFRDERGHFAEIWRQALYEGIGIPAEFEQDNVSFSRRHVLRGLHFQNPNPQGKLVSTLQGRVFDVAVDLRLGSPTFAEWIGVELSAENMRQLWVPEGFAHGFLVLSDHALVSYKCTRGYEPGHDRCVRWDDADIGIDWGVRDPILSPKDAAAPLLREFAAGELFRAAPGSSRANEERLLRERQ